MVTIVLDDTTSLMTTGNTDGSGTWVHIPGARFFDGSSTYAPFAANANDTTDSGNYGTLEVTFDGTSIAFIGNTPPSSFSQNIFVSIDGNPSYETWYDDPSPPSALQWYQSPMLSDGPHTISITHIAATSVDLMMITAGQNTPLSGQTLIVDDSDQAIQYSGSWTRKTGLYQSSDEPHTGQPYGNATHQTTSIGASATFSFTGTSVSVWSVIDYSHLGSLGVIFTLDSVPYPQTFSVTVDTSQYDAGVLQRENSLLWSSDTISAGTHTLEIEVTSSTNETPLVLDYLLYTPSFSTLATMPETGAATSSAPVSVTGTQSKVVTPSSPEVTSSSQSQRGSSSTSTVSSSTTLNSSATFAGEHTIWVSGSGTVTITGQGAIITSGAGSASVTSVSSSSRVTIGTVAGAIVGGVVLLALLLLLLLFCLRMRKRGKQSNIESVPPLPFMQNARPPTIEPFMENRSTFVAAEKSHLLTSAIGLGSPNISATEYGYLGSGTTYHPGLGNSLHGGMQEKTGLTLINTEHQSTLSPSQLSFSPVTPSTVVAPDIQRVQDMQGLVNEFNRAVSDHGAANARVAELQARISEITYQTRDQPLSTRRDTVTTITVPPPYEPSRC